MQAASDHKSWSAGALFVSIRVSTTAVHVSFWFVMFNKRSKTVFLVLLLSTLMLVLYWSSEMISDHVIRVGKLGKRYIYLTKAVKLKSSFKVSQS